MRLPWQKSDLVKDLPARDVGHLATLLLRRSGRTFESNACIYRALEVDPVQPEAIVRLSEQFDDARAPHEPTPEQELAAVVLSFALRPEVTLGPAVRQELLNVQTKLQWAWGYARSSSGGVEMNELGFLSANSHILARYSSPTAAFQSAQAWFGLKTGLLTVARGNPPADPAHVDLASLQPTALYAQWLKKDAAPLRAILAENP